MKDVKYMCDICKVLKEETEMVIYSNKNKLGICRSCDRKRTAAAKTKELNNQLSLNDFMQRKII